MSGEPWSELPEPSIDSLEQTIAALRERNAELEKIWRCFHCGFETSDRVEASGHFGEYGEGEPLCVFWAELSDHERLVECQNVCGQLTEEREENLRLRAKIEGLEFCVAGQLSEIHSFKPFRECDSIQQIFNVYDSMEGRALLAEEQRDQALSELAEARKDTERLDWLAETSGAHRKFANHSRIRHTQFGDTWTLQAASCSETDEPQPKFNSIREAIDAARAVIPESGGVRSQDAAGKQREDGK